MSACHAEDREFESRRDRHLIGPVAQLVEQKIEDLRVGSSILSGATLFLYIENLMRL